MNFFQLFCDRKKRIAFHFMIVFLFFSVFFCLCNRISNKFIVRYLFVSLNNIETLLRTSDRYANEGYLYIYATSCVDAFLPDCEVFMQTKPELNIERYLSNNEIIISAGIAEKERLNIGDSILIKKLYESNYNSYVVKDIIYDSYLKMSDEIFEFRKLIFLPYDDNFEKSLETQYIVLSKEGFSDLPNDLRIKTSYLVTKSDIKKDVIFMHIILFFLSCIIYFAIYSATQNILHENLFERIYNLFNLGQEKIKNILLLYFLIFFMQWFPMQLAILVSCLININTYLFFITFIISSCFNILTSLIMFCVTYYKDMRQGRTSLLW